MSNPDALLNLKRALIRSSTHSISEPMIEKSAFESTSTRTPSCSTTSSNRSGFSTYSRW